MAKRFTDSRKWDDPWFLELPNTDRLIWLYILDKCDHAGIYKHSNKMLGFFIEGADWEGFLNTSNSRVRHLENDKYFIPKFIDFQYGELNESVNCHKSVIAELKKLRVDELLIKGCSTLKDKDKVKDKGKDKEQRKNFDEIWSKYPKKDGKDRARRSFKASVKTQEDWEDINKAIDNYLGTKTVQAGYIKNGSTWFNQWRDFIDYKEANDGGRDPTLYRDKEI